MYFLFKSKKGFTLIELLVVMAIISLLSSVVLVALTTTKIKARDAIRASDMNQIKIALDLFYNEYGCLPVTNNTICEGATGYNEYNIGGWDYSHTGGFMTFLKTAGFLKKDIIDPVNNMTGDNTPAGTYAYSYYCYGTGPTLRYKKEVTGSTYVNVLNQDGNYVCK